ncbi:siphovirus ReqiPepy6 Gp37-like family protein [Nocardiopsis rhodophaea]|uniref:siphovirus ReqiPepy6 Gp37-like family protein n=2 Tax=Nocardiopsis rhodophaea TaxID=280238 RepID=UPI0031DC0FB3
MEEWVVRVRDQDRNMIGEIDDEQELEVHARHLSAGSWKLEVASNAPTAELLEDGAGIQFEIDGRVVFSGPITKLTDKLGEDDAGSDHPTGSGTLTATGTCDTTAFRRVIYPYHRAPITTKGSKHPLERETLRGPAETVIGEVLSRQAGPAALATRRHPGLVVPTSGKRGPRVTSAERFTDLHEHLFSLAQGAGVGWRIVQHGADLVFEFYEPRDLTRDVGFGVELGNVAAYTYELTPPEVTHLVYGCGGEGKDRLLFEYARPSPLFPGLRIEEFIDQRDLSEKPESKDDDQWRPPGEATAQMAEERFAEAKGTQTVAFDLLPTDGAQWGKDVDLGDRVTFLTDRGPVTDTIREVVYRRTPDDGQTITPVVGDPINLPQVYRALKRLRADVDRLQAA